MLVRIWRLVTIMVIALSMGTALCHLLEMPAKITYDGALWLTLLQTLYPPPSERLAPSSRSAMLPKGSQPDSGLHRTARSDERRPF
jgi:hypothetical protein